MKASNDLSLIERLAVALTIHRLAHQR